LVNNALALRLAVANLLRVATSALGDARAILERGNRRSAAVLAKQAFTHVLRALAASEHGWPVEEMNAGLAAVPEANPFRRELADLDAVVGRSLAPAVKTDGRLAPEPNNRRLAEALSQAAGTVEAVAKAFKVDLAGTRPAGHVAAIRPKPDPAPPEPEAPVPAPVARQEATRPAPLAAAEPRTPKAPKLEPARKAKPAPAVRKRAPSTEPAPPPHRTVIAENPPAERRPALKQNSQAEPAVAHWPERPQTLKQTKTAAPDTTGPPSAAGPQPVQPLAPARQAPDVSSAAFWSLMECWKIGDLEALDLIRHPGGLTKKGTRPRFRLVGPEAELFTYLKEIDTALKALGTEPADWIHQPIKEDPFKGTIPLAHIAHGGVVGARDVVRKIMATGLQL
jgi:HEPN domain-containing protein